MTRITGLATGLDIDAIVKQSMQAYQSKIDVQKQQKDILEIKQQLYRDIIKEAQDLYNKHFDVLKDGSLIKGSTWQNIKFDSSSNVLTVTGSSSSKVGNYTIESGTIAKPASITKTSEELGNKITINGQEFEVIGDTNKEKAENLNKVLTKAGISVSVKYTEFAGNTLGNKEAFVFESNGLGKDSGFVIGGTKTTIPISEGKDATGATISGLTVYDLKNNINEDLNVELKIGSVEVNINIAKDSKNSDIESALNKALESNGYSAKIDNLGRVILTSEAKGSGQEKIANIKIGDTFKNISFKDGEDATLPEKVDITSFIKDSNEKIEINGITIDLSGTSTLEEKVTAINRILEENESEENGFYINISFKEEDEGNPLVMLESYIVGSNSKIEVSKIDDGEVITGEDAKITIRNSNGSIYTYEGNSNTFSLDGINFSFTGEIPSEGIKVTSSQDSSKILESIKNYIDDYNSLITKINTLTSEKRDRNYQPLTDAQKEAMTEREIELWEAKVKQGQLRNDSDLKRISSALRQGMTSLVSGTGLTLEDIGIESVNDYGGTKDGTFKVNETKLKEALENNLEEISKMFTQSTTDTSNNAFNQKGIMIRLKEILYDETVSSKSILSEKVGFEGTVTVANNTLSKQMLEYQKKIDEMNSLFASKEQALYSQYAKLEVIMNNYNSQMSYLTQSLGLA